MSTTTDKLSLEECSEFISISDKDSEKWTVFATINVNCRRSGIGKYEVAVQAEMDFGLTNPAQLSTIEEYVLKRYRLLEPTVSATTTRRVSRELAALLRRESESEQKQHGTLILAHNLRGGSEDEEIFINYGMNVSFVVARLTTGVGDLIAGGSAAGFDDVAKAASERVRALRQIHENVEKGTAMDPASVAS